MTRISRLLFIILCFFAACTGHKEQKNVIDKSKEPGSPEFYFDKAKEAKTAREKISFLNQALLVTESKKDSMLPYLFNFKIYYHNRLKEYDSSLHFAEKLIEIAQIQKDTFYLGEAFYRKSKIHSYLQNPKERFKYAFESRRHYLAVGDSSKAGRRTYEMALAQRRSGDVTGSQKSATEALRYLDLQTDSTYISSSYNIIGTAYKKQGLYDQAISEYQNSMGFSPTRQFLLPDLNNIALIYIDTENYDSAIAILEQIILEINPTDQKRVALYKGNLAYAKWKKEPDLNVQADLLEVLEIRKKVNDKQGLVTSYDRLTEYFRNRDKAKARRYADNHFQAAKDYGGTNAELNALKQLIDLAASEEVGALTTRYFELNDSLNYANLKAKNTFAKIRLDEERKQQRISDLEARNALQQLETSSERQRKIIYFSTGVLILLGGSFFIFFLRQQHKKEKLQEVYRTESRISKKVHDELANDMYTLMTQLQEHPQSTDLDNLENIYQRTRDISRENSSIRTGEDFYGELLAMLGSYTPSSIKLFSRGIEMINWKKIPEQKQIVVYRVLQELMTNMKKHSKASLVALHFTEGSKNLHIQYSDNGIGVDPNEVRYGCGVQNVENRIYSVNGSFIFETANDKGFKAELKIPI